MFRSKKINSFPLIFIFFFQLNSIWAQSSISNKPMKTPHLKENKTNTIPNSLKFDSAQFSGNTLSNHSQIKLLPPEKLTKDYTDALKQILNLSNAQYNRMIQVNRVLIDQIDALVYSSKDYPSFLLGLKLADKARMDKYRVFLTPSQFKAYSQDSSLSGFNKVNLKANSIPGNPVMK